MTTNLRAYEAAIRVGTGAVDALHAIYLMERSEPYTDEVAHAGLSWANPRVSARLLGRGLPDDLYMRFAAHLRSVGSGGRRELRAISHNKAWSIIAGDAELTP
jgi:hypothetical protein